MARRGEPVQLTARDREVLETLTLRVRALTVVQIAETWWRGTKNAPRNARQRIEQLEADDWVKSAAVLANPEEPACEPLCAWQPGQPVPELGRIAYEIRHRWTEPPVTTRLVIATRKAASVLGGRGGRFPRPTEVNHDVRLARVYLVMRDELPTRAASWESEDIIYHARKDKAEKLPDAIVQDGRDRTVVECTGTGYRKEHLKSLHSYCEEQDFGYELW